jgi:hypothetical protein
MLLAGSSIARFVLLPASARLGGFSTLIRVETAFGKYLQQRFSIVFPGARAFGTLVHAQFPLLD